MLLKINGQLYSVSEEKSGLTESISRLSPCSLVLSRSAGHEYYGTLQEPADVTGARKTSHVEAGGIYYFQAWGLLMHMESRRMRYPPRKSSGTREIDSGIFAGKERLGNIMMKKEVMIVTGAGQIGMAIARRTGFGKKIILGDKSLKNAETIAEIMNNAGYDVVPFEMDLSSRESILAIINEAQKYGEIKYLVNAAGVSPSQAPIEAILKVDLYGTAVLLEEVGKVIAEGGAGGTISSQSGWRMPQLTPEEDRQLAMTPTEELLSLPLLQPENIRDTLHAYQLAKRCNEKRVMYECVRWGERGARLNDIAPGIIVTPLAVDEFNGPRGDFYKNMFAKCPAGRPGTADEMANIAELLMSDAGAFITGSTFLADGGATASYYYGSLQPQE